MAQHGAMMDPQEQGAKPGPTRWIGRGVPVIIAHGGQQNHLCAFQILRSKGEVFLFVYQNLIGEVASEGGLKGKVEGPRKTRRPLEKAPKKRPADPAACEHETQWGFAGHETPIFGRRFSNRPKMLLLSTLQ
jgi:hypothetical protein